MSIQKSLARNMEYLLTSDQDDDYNHDDDGNQGSGREGYGIGRAVARGACIRSILRSDAAGLALPGIVRRQREVGGGLRRHDGMPWVWRLCLYEASVCHAKL